MPPLSDETAARLKRLHEDAQLSKAEERFQRGGWWADGPYDCLECHVGIRKPRVLKYEDGSRRATLTWCCQKCKDAWVGRMNDLLIKAGRATKWEKYDQNGNLIGYVIPRRGYVSLEQIEIPDEPSGGGENDPA